MKIEFLAKFNKDIDKLVDVTIKEKIAEVIDAVENANKIGEIKDIKKLKGFKFAYRIKIGDYRIGVFIENGIVEFARVIHRKDIYKMFP